MATIKFKNENGDFERIPILINIDNNAKSISIEDTQNNFTVDNVEGALFELIAKLREKSDLIGGKIPSSQLPSYVDDVIEGNLSTFPTVGENGKIYIDTDTNITYRWSGSIYTSIGSSLALGETASTAYRGDRGKIAYEHSQVAHAPATAQKNSDITKAEIEAKLIGNIATHSHDIYATLELMKSKGYIEGIYTYIDDLNNAIENGFYDVGNETLNRPPNTEYGTVIVLCRQPTPDFRTAQLYLDSYDAPTKMYYRCHVSSGWTTWQKIASMDATKVSIDYNANNESIEFKFL